MKAILSYYGGKQRMAHNIVPLIPKHLVYVEPFAGGLAVLFDKPLPKVTNGDHYREVINDIDGDLVNFYRVLRSENGPRLCSALALTPYSREEYIDSLRVLTQKEASDFARAHAYYISVQASFANKLRGGFAFSKKSCNHAVTWINKVQALPSYLDRMSGLYVEHDDVIAVIRRWDSPWTCFYCDPPYPETEQKYAAKYNIADYNNLIKSLSEVQGSFLLSGYATEGIVIPDSWENHAFSAAMSANKNKREPRQEMLYRKVNRIVDSKTQKLYDSEIFSCFTG